MRLFLSDASGNEDWKQPFATWLMRNIGEAQLIDYRHGQGAPFASITKWVSDQVSEADVFIALVSADYIRNKYPLTEWQAALDQVPSGRLVFVPILLDYEAKRWWSNSKRSGKIKALGDDYAYSDFTDENGEPVYLGSDQFPNTPYTRKIKRLAELIRTWADNKAPPPPPPPRSKGLIILGHPAEAFGRLVGDQVKELESQLSEQQTPYSRWGDEWIDNADARDEHALSDETWFVQPIGRLEAGDYLSDPQMIRTKLRAAIRSDQDQSIVANCKVLLWLPKSFNNDPFKVRAEAPNAPDRDPVLSHHDPAGLAEYLLNQIAGDVAGRRVPVVHLECQPSENREIAKIRDALHAGFYKALQGIVVPDPYKYPWEDANRLKEQLKKLSGDKIIVAVHDLAMGRNNDLELLTRKLGDYRNDIDEALHDAGRSDVRVFKSVMLCKKVSALPCSMYPRPECGRWFHLPYDRSEKESEPPVKPRDADCEIFQTYLRGWMNGIEE